MNTLNKLIHNLKTQANEDPVVFTIITGLTLLWLYYILGAAEIFPEIERVSWKGPEGQRVVDLGDNQIWMGMELAPVTRGIRKEFNLPRKVKGMFVVNEGSGLARARGIRTGDIIGSINRTKITGTKSFYRVANNAKYYEGILLDVFRDGNHQYVTIPYIYENGPVLGPNKGHWQLGSPVVKQMMPYSPLVK